MMILKNALVHILRAKGLYRSILISVILLPTNLYANDHDHSDHHYAIFSFDSNFTEISINKARKLYKGKTKRLNGKKVELSDWPESSDERNDFYLHLLGKTPSQMNAHWVGLSFSGKVRYPKEIDAANISSLIKWLKQKPYRIGYAPLASIPKNANLLYIVNSEN